jgi:hypothetical protein
MFDVMIGGLITLMVSWIFYHRAADDLRKEAAELRRLIALVKGTGSVGFALAMRGKGTVTQPEGWRLPPDLGKHPNMGTCLPTFPA